MKLPRFQFRLRTLMIVVTLLAVPLGYVGWQVRMVRERKACLERIVFLQGAYAPSPHSHKSAGPSQLRLWLGDWPIDTISLPAESARTDDVERIKATFPEAKFLDAR